MNSLSIIIPAYNEEENIFECVKRIPKMPWETEIIVVDDGSADKTLDLLKKLKIINLKVISYKPNRGKGYACRMGFKSAKGDVITILDADMATMPEEIPLVVKPIFDREADFVNTTRFKYKMEKGAMKLLHKPGNFVFALITSFLLRQRVTDTLCGFKAFNKKLDITKLKEDSWPDFDLFLTAKRQNLKIVEVPIHYKTRKGGVSKMKTFKHGYNMLRMLLRSLFK